MQILSGRRHPVTELAFSHCGRWLAACGEHNGGIQVWDTAAPAKKPVQPNPAEVVCARALTFRHDGRLFFRDNSGRWCLYDPSSGASTELAPPESPFVVVSPDGRRLLHTIAGSTFRTFAIHDEGPPVPELTIEREGTYFSKAKFTADGSAFVIAQSIHSHVDGKLAVVRGLALRKSDSGEVVREWLSAFPNTLLLTLSKDASYLVECAENRLACWNLSKLDEPPRKATNPGRKYFLHMAIHPAGPLLTVDNDRVVRVWDVPTLATDRAIEWNIGKLHAVAVSPDGTRAAVGSHTGKVLVWDWD